MATKSKSGKKTAGSAASKKKNTSSATKSAQAKEAEKKEEALEAKRQILAIVLLAVSILLLAVVIIPAGETSNVWNWLRNILFGLFGLAAYILPVILIVLDIMILAGRMTSKISFKIVEALILMSLIVSFVHIVQYDSETAKSFGQQFVDAFNMYRQTGKTLGSGCLGALIGGGILAATGGTKVPAGIFICLLLFVFLMFFTGTPLGNLYRALKKPVKKVGEYTEDKIDMFKEAAHSQNNTDEMDELAAVAEKAARKRTQSADSVPNAASAHPVQTGSDIDIPLDPKSSEDMGIDSIFSEMEKNNTSQGKNQPEFLRLINNGDEQKQPHTEEFAAKQDEKKTKSKSEQGAKNPATVSASAADAEAETNKNKRVYLLPPIDCLKKPSGKGLEDHSEELQINAKKIVQTLNSFGVSTRIVDICRSPSVTRYELQPDPGVKISRITSLADDLALSLAAAGVRIEAPIPNKAAVGIEVPNKERNLVLLRELIDTPQFKSAKSKLNIALGRDIQGTPTYTDIAKMPHLLIAGTTGSGKSVCLNTMIISLLYNAAPNEVKIILIDPKMVEFSVYGGIPHLLVPVVADPRKASGSLSWAVSEMEKRYKLFSEFGVRNLQGYNAMLESKGSGEAPMPQIVMFIDELSDLMMVASNEVESSICRLAQKARAAGMHLVVATQRPSVDVITGLIKANIPSRLALSVSSQIDSRTILDCTGAEKLLGNGDMLFCPVGTSKPIRLQGAYVSDEEIEAVVAHIKAQEQVDYDDEVMEEIERHAAMGSKKKKESDFGDIGGDDTDELFPKAVEVVLEAGMASTTLLQRKLKLGYARAARIVDELAEKKIIGPFQGSKPREVLISKQQWYEMRALSPDPVQVTYEDVSSESSVTDADDEDGDSDADDLSSGDHNYFGGYSHENFEDVYSSSYDKKNDDNN